MPTGLRHTPPRIQLSNALEKGGGTIDQSLQIPWPRGILSGQGI